MKKFLLLCFSFGFALSVMAQDRVVTGRVTSKEDGTPLPGVNVVIKGTTSGTVTDADGKFSLSVPASSGSLVFSFIGLSTQEVEIGERTVVDVQLGLDIQQLSEVVVTAQGIEREQKALGFAQTTISSSLLANKPETDIGRALQGRTPGLQVLSSSGLAGSGSKVNIRGISTITGNSQPLWVVNGVPINTAANDINDFRDGQIAPTRFLDIDPNNIESISVLRGLQATTTYGSQGRNGVILVTTKTGASKGLTNKFEGNVTQQYYAMEAIIPEYQNKWTNGFDGAYGEFFSNWGRLFDGKPTGVRHPYWEWRNVFPDRPEFATGASTILPGQTLPGYIPVPQPNNVKDFFVTGSSSTTSLSLRQRTDFGIISFNYSHLDERGFIKNNDLLRDNFSLGVNTKLTEKLSLNATYNFVRTDQQTPPAAGGGGSNSFGGPSIWANLFYTPRNIDLTNWPWENPVDKSSVYYRNNNSITNPRWLLVNTRQTNITNRFYSNTTLNYKLNSWLDITYRLWYDTYSERQNYWINKGGGSGFDAALTPGAYRAVVGSNTLLDHSVLVNFKKDISSDLNLAGVVGYNYRSNKYYQQGFESLGQITYGLIEARNFQNTLQSDWRGNQLNYQDNSAIQGVFFDSNLGYKNYLYVALSGRNDWTSTLERSNSSLFYPGASVSFIPTAAFPNLASNVLDFLKIRVAYGTSSNFGPAYVTRQFLAFTPQYRKDFAGNPISALGSSSRLGNPNLKPELLQETEVGVESKFFNDRIKLDISYYNRLAKDQIIDRPLDFSTGYGRTYINAGTLSNSGIEASLTVTPIRNENWRLDFTTNFTKNVSKVTSLPEGSKEILVSGFSNLGNFAVEGQPFNVIKGTYVPRAPDGQFIINDAGSYQTSNDIGIIGNPNPNWFGSLITSLSWKSLTLGMQWDYVSGGQVFSYYISSLIGRGVSRDLENFDPTLPLVLPGVIEQRDGSGNVTGYTQNNMPLTTAGVFFGNSIIGGGPSDRGIYDATRVRFREISLTYSLPKSLIAKTKLKGVRITAIGNNLWFRAINAPKYTNADFDRTPFGTGNGAGFDFVGGPSARRYGFNLTLTF